MKGWVERYVSVRGVWNCGYHDRHLPGCCQPPDRGFQVDRGLRIHSSIGCLVLYGKRLDLTHMRGPDTQTGFAQDGI